MALDKKDVPTTPETGGNPELSEARLRQAVQLLPTDTRIGVLLELGKGTSVEQALKNVIPSVLE